MLFNARHYNSIWCIFNNQFNNKSMLNYICVNHNMKLLITYSHMKAWFVGIAAIKMFYACIAHSLQHVWLDRFAKKWKSQRLFGLIF